MYMGRGVAGRTRKEEDRERSRLYAALGAPHGARSHDPEITT